MRPTDYPTSMYLGNSESGWRGPLCPTNNKKGGREGGVLWYLNGFAIGHIYHHPTWPPHCQIGSDHSILGSGLTNPYSPICVTLCFDKHQLWFITSPRNMEPHFLGVRLLYSTNWSGYIWYGSGHILYGRGHIMYGSGSIQYVGYSCKQTSWRRCIPNALAIPDAIECVKGPL